MCLELNENMSDKKSWFVYIVETQNGRLYTGVSTDVDRRFSRHEKGAGGGGAKFFSFSAPKRVLYREECINRSVALRREAALKRLSRRRKLEVIESGNGGIVQLCSHSVEDSSGC